MHSSPPALGVHASIYPVGTGCLSTAPSPSVDISGHWHQMAGTPHPSLPTTEALGHVVTLGSRYEGCMKDAILFPAHSVGITEPR